MSGSPSRPARVLPGALLGLVLAAPAGVLAVPSASAAPRVEVAPMSDACGVRLDLRGLPARTFTVHLDLVALDPVRALPLVPAGPREVDGGSPAVEVVAAEGLPGAETSQTYRATVRIDGEALPQVELLLPECADPATATASPTATATAPLRSPGATPSPSGTAGPGGSVTATPSPTGTADPATSPTSATSTATLDAEPTEAPVFGPRAVSAPATGGSGVVALSGGVAAAPLGALPEPAAPAPVVAPPTGGVTAAVAAAPPLAAALPVLPGRPGPVAAQPASQTIAPETAAAPPVVASDPTAADESWTGGLPVALLLTGAAAGALGLRLRRRRPQNP